MSYNIKKLEEPNLANVLIDEFNNRGYIIVSKDYADACHYITIMTRSSSTALVAIKDGSITFGSCLRCDIYSGESFDKLFDRIEYCLTQAGCGGCKHNENYPTR